MNSSENYNDILIDIKQVVFVANSGVNDQIIAISNLLTLLDYYCPNCEVIYYTDITNHSYGWVDYKRQEDYIFDLKAIDNRFQYFSKSMKISDSTKEIPQSSSRD